MIENAASERNCSGSFNNTHRNYRLMNKRQHTQHAMGSPVCVSFIGIFYPK